MGNISSKPKWAPIKHIYNDGICYLTNPPQYSPNIVVFEDGTEKAYPAKEIIAELERQNKSHLWKDRFISMEDRELWSAVNKLMVLKKEKSQSNIID